MKLFSFFVSILAAVKVSTTHTWSNGFVFGFVYGFIQACSNSDGERITALENQVTILSEDNLELNQEIHGLNDLTKSLQSEVNTLKSNVNGES